MSDYREQQRDGARQSIARIEIGIDKIQYAAARLENTGFVSEGDLQKIEDAVTEISVVKNLIVERVRRAAAEALTQQT